MKFRTSIKDETSLSEKGDDLPPKKNTAEKCNTVPCNATHQKN